MNLKNKSGFTLIELILVMAIISILSIFAVVTAQVKRLEARNARRIADMNAVHQAMSLSCHDKEILGFTANSSVQPTLCKTTGSSYLDFSTLTDPSVNQECLASSSGCSSDSSDVCQYAFGDPEDITLLNGNAYTAIPTEIDPCNYIINFYLEDEGYSYINAEGMTLAEAEAEETGEQQNNTEGFVDLSGYNQVVYADFDEGSDITGDGSEANPYATFNQAYADIISNNNQAIFLTAGEYTCSVDDTHLKVMDIIGAGKDTTLFFEHSKRWIEGAQRMYSIADLTFYKLIFKTEVNGNNLFYGDDTNFYNVAFDMQGGNDYSINTPGSNFYNCTDVTSPPLFLHGTHTLENCYGRFYPGNGTNYSDYTVITSMITQPDLDYNFHILESGWQDTGTGLDLDGSQADLGVYGGQYSWGD